MSRAAFTLKAFAVYLYALGLVLAVSPNLLLTTFGFPSTDEVWIRVLGLVVINLGAYYWFAAKSEARPFFVASVFTRIFVLFAFTGLAALGLAKPMLILFGAIDTVGGLWTLSALRRDRDTQFAPKESSRQARHDAAA